MECKIRNITNGYGWVLKHQVGPNESLDLRKIFAGFCQPKVSSREDLTKLKAAEKRGSKIPFKAAWSPDQFDAFVDWVQNEVATDRRKWVFEFSDIDNGEEPVQKVKATRAPVDSTKIRKSENKKSTSGTRAVRRKISKDEYTAKQIAWFEYNDQNKKVISECSDVRKLKMALKLARNLAGQERVRILIEERIVDLGTEGIS